jgi:hypothetical protein
MLTIEGYVSLTKGEFMKNMFLLSAALLMIIGNKALAADGGTMGSDNIVEVRMDADVVRSCNLDFNSVAGAQIVEKDAKIGGAAPVDNVILASNGPASIAPVVFDAISVYETCNDDFKLEIRSLHGGLAHSSDGGVTDDRVIPYNIKYTSPSDATTQFSSTSTAEKASLVTAPQISKSLAGYQAKPGQSGSAWNHTASSLQLDLMSQEALPKGHYSDLLQIQMSAN